MYKIASPFRYPGGKSCLFKLTKEIIRLNKLRNHTYAEPFAGGGGLALTLLYSGAVSSICLNDIDQSIWAVWHSMLYNTDDFIDIINKTPVTVDNWHHSKATINDPQASTLDRGFATFFLNRTNRSGIIQKAGMIGGLNQSGNYKLDCRFNKKNLIERIKKIATYRDAIKLSNLDALDFLKDQSMPEETFFCIDPPYFQKGSGLYTNFYKPEDHSILGDLVLSLDYPWIVTYDNNIKIADIYKSRRQFDFDINYSVQTKRVGSELLIASKGLRIPKALRSGQYLAR